MCVEEEMVKLGVEREICAGKKGAKRVSVMVLGPEEEKGKNREQDSAGCWGGKGNHGRRQGSW